MKVFIDTYNTALQAKSGGVNIKTMMLYKQLISKGIDIKLFNKYTDKINECDILFIVSPEYEHYSLVQYAKKNNIKIVVASVKTMDFKFKKWVSYYLGKVKLKNLEFITGEILRMSDLVISETELEKVFINKYYKVPMNKLCVIPNGVEDISKKPYNDMIYKKIGNIGNYVLCTGRFDKNKNQLNLIKGLKSSNIPVVFMGGPTAESVDYYKKCLKEANKNMYFLGWVEHGSDLFVSAYQNAKVVAMPSKYEIFGNALIEGGMSGANLVATDVLPIDEWGIGTICKKMNANDVEEIHNVINLAFNESNSNLVYKTIREKFSWEVVIKQYMELLERVYNNDN